MVYAARFASTRADAAVGFELDVIAAALLGGVSIFGGRGSNSSAPCSGCSCWESSSAEPST